MCVLGKRGVRTGTIHDVSILVFEVGVSVQSDSRVLFQSEISVCDGTPPPELYNLMFKHSLSTPAVLEGGATYQLRVS